jgi:hypothetical protein
MGKLSPLLVPTVQCSAVPGIVVCEPRRARQLTAPRGPVATPLRIAAGEWREGWQVKTIEH